MSQPPLDIPQMEAAAARVERLVRSVQSGVRTVDVAASVVGDESTVSRIKSLQYGVKLDRLGAYLYVHGLRVVPRHDGIVEVPIEEYQGLVRCANIGTRALGEYPLHPRLNESDEEANG